MNSSGIQLYQSPLPVAPSGRLFSATRAAHGSLRSFSKTSHLVSSSRLHRFSELEREKKKNDMVRGGSLAMASCVFGPFSLSVGKMKNKATILASIAGDDQRSNAAQEKEGSVTGPLKKLKSQISFENEPDDKEIEALKFYVMALSKVDSEGAQEILNEELKKWENRPAYHTLLVSLVELLVHQRNHPEAKEKIDKLLEDEKYKEAEKKIEKILEDGKYKEAEEKIDELLEDVSELLDEIGKGLPKEKVYLLKAIAESENETTKATLWWKIYQRELLSSPHSSFKKE